MHVFILHIPSTHSKKEKKKTTQSSSKHTATMASSSNLGKRIKKTVSAGRFANERGHLKNWFTGPNSSENSK